MQENKTPSFGLPRHHRTQLDFVLTISNRPSPEIRKSANSQAINMAIRSNRNELVNQDVFGEVVVHTNNFSIPPSPIQSKRKRLGVSKDVGEERTDTKFATLHTMRRPSYYKTTNPKSKVSSVNFENETKINNNNRHSFCGCKFCNVEELGYEYNDDDFTSSVEYTKAMILLENSDLPKWLRRQIESKIRRKDDTSE